MFDLLKYNAPFTFYLSDTAGEFQSQHPLQRVKFWVTKDNPDEREVGFVDLGRVECVVYCKPR